MAESIPCPYCEGSISETARKCRHCGEWVRTKCARCGTELRWEWARRGICAECEEAPVPAVPVARQLERGKRGAGNVVAALASLFIPGLGQLGQGRVISAMLLFFLNLSVWFVTFGSFGWVIHAVAAADAALYTPKR